MRDDTPQAKLDKLDALLAQTSTSADDAALLAAMLSLPNDGRYPAFQLTPQQRRQRTLGAIVSQIATLSCLNPVLMIFEDAHWSDPTSLELFSRIVNRIQMLHVLLVMTFRPEFNAPWIGQPHVSAITLSRLTRRELETMIDRVASLMARLDRLGAAKEVAQIGAAIGREFSHDLLAAVMTKAEKELNSALDRLIAAGLLFRQGVAPNATYLFKHALVQDAAYGTLLREPRRTLHARIANTLESQFAEIAEKQPELLARHYTEAGLIEKSARLWAKAGQRSLERSALVEAVEQFTRALAQMATLPSAPALHREQIKLQLALITPLVHVKGYSAPETKAAVEEARVLLEQADALGETPDDPLQLFAVLYGAFVANIMAFNADVSRDIAAQVLELAEKQSASFPRVLGHNHLGGSLMQEGDFAAAKIHFDQAIALYDPAAHRPLAARFGEDQTVPTLAMRSRALWHLGYPEAALRDTDDALKSARETGQAASLMFALGWTSIPLILRRDYSRATALAQELCALANEKDAPPWRVNGSLNQAVLFALTGKPSTAIELITAGIMALRPTGVTLGMPWWLLHLAIAHAELCQLDDARRCIGEAISMIEATKERWSEAETNRAAGEIEFKSPKPDATKAEAYFERALAVARQQQTNSWELRASMSLARLWRDQGKVREARELLAPVHGWFTEGFDTRDLKEAKALLQELAA